MVLLASQNEHEMKLLMMLQLIVIEVVLDLARSVANFK